MRTWIGTTDIVLFGLACLRLHNIETEHPDFVFHLTLVFAFGLLLVGDLDYWIDWMNLEEVNIVGNGARYLSARLLLLAGLLYINIKGESRNRPTMGKK